MKRLNQVCVTAFWCEFWRNNYSDDGILVSKAKKNVEKRQWNEENHLKCSHNIVEIVCCYAINSSTSIYTFHPLALIRFQLIYKWWCQVVLKSGFVSIFHRICKQTSRIFAKITFQMLKYFGSLGLVVWSTWEVSGPCTIWCSRFKFGWCKNSGYMQTISN